MKSLTALILFFSIYSSYADIPEKKSIDLIKESDIVMGKFLEDKVILHKGIAWSGGIIPYVIAPEIKFMEATILSAIEQFHNSSLVRFVPRANQSNYIKLVFGELNNSSVAMIGEEQEVSLSQFANEGTVLHELGHALGLWHEHSRPDRDKYVSIFYDNITPGKEYNFDLQQEWIIPLYKQSAYDFKSIMHYGSNYCSKNGKATILTIEGERIEANRGALSKEDITDINSIYEIFNQETCFAPSVDTAFIENGKENIYLKVAQSTLMAFPYNERKEAHRLKDFLNDKKLHQYCVLQGEFRRSIYLYFKSSDGSISKKSLFDSKTISDCENLTRNGHEIEFDNSIISNGRLYKLKSSTEQGRWWRKIHLEQLTEACSSKVGDKVFFIFKEN